MDGDSTDGSPRLPARPSRDATFEQLELDLVDARRRAALAPPDWPPFEDPPLLPLRGSRRLVIAARALAFIWSLAVVVAAILHRSGDGAATDASLASVGRVGIVVATALATVGWHWTDRVTRNAHLLGGRLPRRPRGITAWTAPLAWSALVATVVLRLDPTEVVDVRPAIAVAILALAWWRPYSLVRRILRTLTRLQADAVIGAAYVLELAGFGLLWWQLAAWPDRISSTDTASIDIMIGASAAAAVAFGGNLVMWTLLVTVVERSQTHRLVALRTRHDHRHLRLRGIDPMDPAVRWALLSIRRQQELDDALDASPPAPTPTPDADHNTAQGAAPAAVNPPAPVAPVMTGRSDGSSPLVPAPEADPDSRSAGSLNTPDSTATEPIGATGPRADDATPNPPRVDRLMRRLAEANTANDPSLTLPSAAVGPLASSEPERRPGDIPRIARSIGADRVRRHATEDPASVRVERLAERLGRGDPRPPARSLLERLAEYGITPTEPGDGSAPDESGGSEPRASESWAVPRLYGLEAARHVLVAMIAATTGASLWVVVRSTAVGTTLPTGRFAGSDVAGIDLARRAFVSALGMTFVAVTLWGVVVIRHARGVWSTTVRTWRCDVAFGVTVVANVLLWLDGERSTTSFAALLGGTAAAGASTATVAAALRGTGLRSSPLVVWAGGVTLILALAWFAGLHRPVTPADSFETLTFCTALQATVGGIAVVVAAASTSDIEDAIRLAPVSRGSLQDG